MRILNNHGAFAISWLAVTVVMIFPAPMLAVGKPTSDQLSEHGLVQYNKDDLEGALADFNRAIKLDTKNPTAYYGRAVIRSLKELVELAANDYARATELDEALGTSSKSQVAYILRGLAKLFRDDLVGAVSDLDRAVALNPKSALAYINRAVVRTRNGDDDGAVADYDRAIELDSNSSSPYVERGIVKFDHQDFDGAIADETQAIKQNPKSVKAHQYRGLARERKGDYAGAESDFGTVIRLAPDSVYIYLQRGRVREKLNDSDGALADYAREIKRDPKRASLAYAARADLKYKNNDIEGAIADCDRAIKLDSAEHGPYRIRGDARRKTGDLDGALSDYSRLIQLSLGIPEYYIKRADVYLDRYDADIAGRHFEQATTNYGSALDDWRHAKDSLRLVQQGGDLAEFKALGARIKLKSGEDPAVTSTRDPEAYKALLRKAERARP